MKKILSLGVAAAVVSLTAVAASAAIAPAFDTDAPVAGETLTVQVVANGMTQEATTFTVNASEGLTLTANEAVTGISPTRWIWQKAKKNIPPTKSQPD